MKKKATLILLALVSMSLFSQEFVHPLDFDGSEAQKKQVIKFIEENVYKTYSAIGMDDPATLRMMEKEELENFKKLTVVTDRELLDSVISTYSSIGMGNYSTIYMMYEEQLKASKETLSW